MDEPIPEAHVRSKGEIKSMSISTHSASSQKFNNSIVDCSSDKQDLEFWSKRTLPHFRLLLAKAEYSASDQEALVNFYETQLLPCFGPRPVPVDAPPAWRSFMTDDYCPLELSWNWGVVSKDVKPTIRLSIEPISRNSGTSLDPWNAEATFDLVEKLKGELPGFDGQLFDQLAPRLMQLCKLKGAPKVEDESLASPSSLFAAFDFNKGQPTAKVYLVPFNHLWEPGKSRAQVVEDFLLPFAQKWQWQSLADLIEYGNSSDTEPFMIAFDCVPLQQNRIKIYFRSSQTSFASMVRILSSHEADALQGDALLQLQDLWQSLFGVDPRTDADTQLSACNHETAGFLYYFEVRPGSRHIVPKVYLPAKHYGRDDWQTAEAIAGFFTRHRKDRKWVDGYLEAVRGICRHRDLGAASGLHTYVSCSVRDGSLDVTSYFNPEVFHHGHQKSV